MFLDLLFRSRSNERVALPLYPLWFEAGADADRLDCLMFWVIAFMGTLLLA